MNQHELWKWIIYPNNPPLLFGQLIILPKTLRTLFLNIASYTFNGLFSLLIPLQIFRDKYQVNGP